MLALTAYVFAAAAFYVGVRFLAPREERLEPARIASRAALR